MKFGGTSVASGETIRRVVEIILSEPRQRVVVVSAMAGVTDQLIEIGKDLIKTPASVVESKAREFSESLLRRHYNAAREVISDANLRGEVERRIEELGEKLRIALMGVGYLADLAPQSLDYILSFGERMVVHILAGALLDRGLDAVAMTGYEAGIITDSSFGRARPLEERLRVTIRQKLKPLLEQGKIPVVTGFIAADEKGRITTLGRGGSDYTAALIACYLEAEEVQIWTDVDGILTADPKIVREARLIDTLSYVEAMDLAYYGAKVIDFKMVEPAMLSNIPVWIKNTFNPSCSGTLIVRKQEEVERVIKAIALMRDMAIINLRGVGLAGTPNIAGQVFSVLGERGINIRMISGSSEANLSFIVSEADLSTAMEALNSKLKGEVIRSLEVMEDVCIISVVGVGMRGRKGVAAKVFKTVADAGVNIIMIAQGSSEVIISFVVKEEDGEKVVGALHRRFIEEPVSFRASF